MRECDSDRGEIKKIEDFADVIFGRPYDHKLNTSLVVKERGIDSSYLGSRMSDAYSARRPSSSL